MPLKTLRIFRNETLKSGLRRGFSIAEGDGARSSGTLAGGVKGMNARGGADFCRVCFPRRRIVFTGVSRFVVRILAVAFVGVACALAGPGVPVAPLG